MALEIKIPPELEQQLQQAAAQAGVAPDVYAMRLLEQGLTLTRHDSGKRLSADETALLQRINHSLSQVNWNRYQTLLANRDAAVLTSDVVRESPVKLSQLIDTINGRFGTDFNQADQLFFDQIVEAATNSEELQQAAQVNSADKFSLLFNQLVESLFVERVDQNEAIFARYMNDGNFQKLVSDWLSSEVYRRLSKSELFTQ